MFSCSPSGFCGRLTQTLQEDDADLWHDLTLHEIPPPPPIPRIVKLTPSPVSRKGNRRKNEEVESLIGLSYLDDEWEWADGAMPTRHWHEEPCLELEETVLIGDIFAATKRQAKHEPHSIQDVRHHETDSRRAYDNDSFDGSSYSSKGKGSVSFLELKPRKLFPRTTPTPKVKSQGTSTTVTETTASTVSI